MRKYSRNILFFLFVFLFSSAFSMLHAQSNSGSISGRRYRPIGSRDSRSLGFDSKSRQRL